MIEFYLGEKPILNNVPTYMCRKPDDLGYVLDHLPSSSSRKCTAPAATACWSGPASTQRRDRGRSARALDRRPERLHRAADARALDLPDLRRERHRAAPHRPAAVRAVGQEGADGAGRADARRAARKARWSSTRRRAAAPRTPGSWRPEATHAVAAPPITCSGWRATWSAPRTPRACSTSTTRCRCCRSRTTAAERGWRGLLQHQRAHAGDFAKRNGEVDAAGA